MLLDAEKQDERLEKAQLQLSSKHKYVRLPDCGHNVIRERPDAVLREVLWIVNSLQAKNENAAGRRQLGSRIGKMLSSLKH